MGLLFRPRRPLMRLAAGAATAGVAYHYGKQRSEQDQYNQQAEAAYQATQYAPPPPGPAYAPAPAAAGTSATADLDHLVALHASGGLSDAEFTAAKAKLLGI